MNSSKVYFAGLDGIRFIAFSMVFVSHAFQGTVSTVFNFTVKSSVLFAVFDSGDKGVSVFFVLSGFLITYLLLKERDQYGKIHIRAFYLRRILRIWPLFYLVLLVGLVVLKEQGSIGYNIFFLNNFDLLQKRLLHSEAFSPVISVTWSIGIEEQFYIVWPLLFYFIRPRMMIYVMYALLLSTLAYRLYNHANNDILYLHSFSVFADLILGGITAYYAFYSESFVVFFSKLGTGKRAAIYLTGIVLFLLNNYLFSFNYGNVLSRSVLTCFYAFVIADQSLAGNSLLSLARVKFVTQWGKYTYGLYLLHPIVLLFSTAVIYKLHFIAISSVAYYILLALVAIALSMLLSYLSYTYFEGYFLRYKKKFDYNN